MSFRLELPQYYTGDEQLRALYAYLTRTVDKLNYALGFLDVPDAAADAAGGKTEDPNNKTPVISEKSTNVQYPTGKAVYDYAVPKTRTVNGKRLTEDIALDHADVGAVPTGRKVNGHALSEDIALEPGDLGAVPTGREINGHALEADILLEPSDLGEEDFVAEEGQTGQWRWRKWDGGCLEIWANMLDGTVDAWSGYGTDFAVANVPVALPKSFYDINYACFACVSRGQTGGSAALVYTVRHTDVDKVTLTLFGNRSYTGTAYKFDIYLCGRWKA